MDKLLKSIFNQTRSIMSSNMERKVREATNDEPLDANPVLMREIASGTWNFQNFHEIMPCVNSRLQNKGGRHRREIYKSLQLLEYIVIHGSERTVDYACSHISTIKVLRDFQCIDKEGKDLGTDVRNRAEELTELLMDVNRVQAERRKARKLAGTSNCRTSSLNDRSGGSGTDSSANEKVYGGDGYGDDMAMIMMGNGPSLARVSRPSSSATSLSRSSNGIVTRAMNRSGPASAGIDLDELIPDIEVEPASPLVTSPEEQATSFSAWSEEHGLMDLDLGLHTQSNHMQHGRQEQSQDERQQRLPGSESLNDIGVLSEHPHSINSLTSILREFKNSFADPSVIVDLHQVDEETLQQAVDIVQFLMTRVEPCDARELERFLRFAVVKRGILPSDIFLTRVHRMGSNSVHGGGFADVWKGEYKGKPVALKVLRLFLFADREKIQREFCKEALLWRRLDHPNVLPLLGICRDEFKPQIALVSHWMEKGSLVYFLSKNLTADRQKMALGVARGLEYLHTLKPQVIHGDLRGANVLVDADNEPKITDFGLAKVIDSQGPRISSFKGEGSVRWHAPELLSVSSEGAYKLTTRTDVYAFSCVCYEIFTETAPFPGFPDGAVIMEVAIHDRRPAFPGPSAAEKGLTNDVWAIMQHCWKKQPADRPDMPFVVSQLEIANLCTNFATMFPS